jgi:hypothetical protein
MLKWLLFAIDVWEHIRGKCPETAITHWSHKSTSTLWIEKQNIFKSTNECPRQGTVESLSP